MKEMTYEDWIKNPTPRMMWVWDNDGNKKFKKEVVYISNKEEVWKVLTIYETENGCTDSMWYEHCAEIEEPKRRPCTREELVEMLKKQGIPMLKCNLNGFDYMVEKISDNYCYVYDCGEYTYQELCESDTLLDGTPLWIEE